jgi:hypothetical protein
MKIAPSKKRGRPIKESEEYKKGAGEPPRHLDAPNAQEDKEHSEPSDMEKEMWSKTLMDAEDIKNDHMKMKHVKAHHEKMMGKIKSIQDIKDYTAAKYGKKRV